MNQDDITIRKPSIITSIAVLAGIITILIAGIFVLEVDIHALLISGLILTCIVSYFHGYTFESMLDGMKESISRAMGAMIIFILIGMIIGSWIICGTVPALIYYGLEFLNPKFFLPLGLIICSITSLGTGTSWGTVATVGIALMGMGTSLGIPGALVAGMIVSGAFFGDKISPISDTTNLAAVSAGTNLYDHIGAMLYTTIPAYIISLAIYTYLGFKYSVESKMDTSTISLMKDTLLSEFNISFIVIIPMLVVLILSIIRFPSIPTMVCGVLAGVVIAYFVQGESLQHIINTINSGYKVPTNVAIIDRLLLRGGIQSMMWTFSLSFIALCLGGVLEKVGYLSVIIHGIVKNIKRVGNLVLVVIFTTCLSNAAMGEVYLSVILNGSLYKDLFKEKGLQPRMLSRLIEEGGTLTGPLIPWTTAGAFVAGTLDISTLEYLPFAFLNLINPILSIVLSYMGIFVLWEKSKKANISQS
ncbi:MAG: Na+/H+ antiporter NhaC [Firmicutes bacterium]|jgi:NhaC family Na+:H+ antiporter|nr:Na+/H+ antiporter NhaC [Bacillota bacterium]